MKKIIFCIILLNSIYLQAQVKKPIEKPEPLNSATRTFIDNSQKTRINKDWSFLAEFKSAKR